MPLWPVKQLCEVWKISDFDVVKTTKHIRAWPLKLEHLKGAYLINALITVWAEPSI